MLFVPYDIEALYEHRPTANWTILGITAVISLAAMFVADGEWIGALVLQRGNLFGLVGHVLLHGGLLHLIGNMLFLWVFGNVICANMKNALYLAIYVFLAIASGTVHLAVDGSPAIGASGAINGVVGLTVAAYPRDRVRVFWWFWTRNGTWTFQLWGLVLLWLVFDLWGALVGGDSVAYWGHIGGLIFGVLIGLVALQSEWIKMTRFDKPNLLQILARRFGR